MSKYYKASYDRFRFHETTGRMRRDSRRRGYLGISHAPEVARRQ